MGYLSELPELLTFFLQPFHVFIIATSYICQQCQDSCSLVAFFWSPL